MTKKLILILFVLLLAGCSGQEFGADLKEWEIDGSPLKLKADKSKLINVVEEDDINCDSTGKNCVNKGKIIRYSYITDEVTTEEYLFDDKEQYSNAKVIDRKSVDGKMEVTAEFESRVFKDIDGKLYKIKENATTTVESFNEQTEPTITEKVLSFFLGKARADNFTSTANGHDGTIYAYSTDWTTVRNATTGTLRTGSTGIVQAVPGYYVERGFFTIPTGALPDDATVTAADWKVYMKRHTQSTGSWNVYGSTHTDTVVAGDFDLAGSTAYCDTAITYSNLSSSYVQKTFSLNSTGRSSISLTGNTKFSMREVLRDIGNDPPGAGEGADMIFYTYETSSSRPVLTVTYTEGGGDSAPTTATPEGLSFN